MGREHELRKEDFRARYFVLFISNLAQITFFYCFDMPAALKDQIIAAFSQKYGQNELEIYFNLFYSLYALPNIYIPLINGEILNKYGTRITFLCCLGLTALGQYFFAQGFSLLSIHLMLFGRLIMGFAGETLLIALTTIISDYFRFDDLSISISINVAFGNIGNLLNMIFTPIIARSVGTEGAIWLASSLSLVSVIAGAVAAWIDKRIERNIDDESILINAYYFNFNNNVDVMNKDELASERRWRRLDTGNKQATKFDKNLLGFPWLFWYLACSSALTYSTIISFSAIAPSYIGYSDYQGMPLEERTVQACRIVGIIWGTSIISSPIYGFIVDRIGMRSRVAILSAILCMAGFILVVVIHAAFPVFLLGFAYAGNFASVWVSIAFIVDKKSISKAFGITIALQSVGVTIFPIINALLRNIFDDYDAASLFLSGVMLISFLFGVRIHQENKQKGGFLELSVRMMDKYGQTNQKREYFIEMVVPELKSQDSDGD